MIKQIFGKEESNDDLRPRGIRSTYQEERAGFNETFVHLFKEIRR